MPNEGVGLDGLATVPPGERVELLEQAAHLDENGLKRFADNPEIAALRERLVKRQSPYEAVMVALLSISKARLDAKALEALRAEPDPEPDDLAALDDDGLGVPHGLPRLADQVACVYHGRGPGGLRKTGETEDAARTNRASSRGDPGGTGQLYR